MKIVHAISTLNTQSGGPSVAVLAMARTIAALGHDIVIHATDLGLARDAVPQSGDVGAGRLQIHIHRHGPFPSLTRNASIGLWKGLARDIPSADVVHLHSLYMFHDWATWRECRKANVPYILQPHGSLDPFMYRHHRARKAVAEILFQNRVTRDATLIHYTSEMERDLAKPYVYGRPAAVAPNGVMLDSFKSLPSPALFRAKYPEIGQRKIVLFLGRLYFKKGLDIVIPAIAEAVRQREDLHLVLAGHDSGFEAKARALTRKHGLERHTTFTGHLELDAMLEALAAADLFVLPSRSENFGIAAAEAMAAGVPSILSDKVHIAAAAAAQGACRIAPLVVSSWTEAILDLLSRPDNAKAMAVRAREYAHSTYSWQSVANDLLEMYQRAIELYRNKAPS